MRRCLVVPALSLVFAAASWGCDVKRDLGETCKDSAGCKDGLVCLKDTCADGSKVTKTRLTRAEKLVQTYMHENDGECPADLKSLNEGKVMMDAWNNEIVMICPGDNFVVDLISNGPDGSAETPDDIRNVEAAE